MNKLYSKIKKLIESVEIDEQLDAITILENENFITKEISDFLSSQFKISKYSYLVPNKFLNVEISNSDTLFIKFNYCYHPQGEIINEFGKIKNLKYLYIYLNDNAQIPENLSKASELEELTINFAFIEYPIDSENIFKILGRLPKLKKLTLNRFDFKNLPSSINHLQCVEKLYLQDNRIQKIPKELGELSKLKILDLSLNSINQLPDEIVNLKSLILLNLHSNQLDQIPIKILNMSNLNHLVITNNKFPYWIKKKYSSGRKSQLIIKK